MNINEKKIYIFNHINDIQNHNFIIKLLDDNDTKYTKNTNGIFLNLNILNDDLISNIYDIIIINTENTGEILYEEKLQTFHDLNNQVFKKEEKIINNVDQSKYLLKHFHLNDKNIIELSKKYKI